MKLMITTVLCAFALAVSSPAFAVLGMPETVEGTIASVSDESLAIVSIQEETQELFEIKINEATQIDEEIASLETLQEGDQVTVKFAGEGDERVALSISRVVSVAPEAAL